MGSLLFSVDISTPSLLSLPNELLEKIAQECPCSAVFNLMFVNHQLHALCNNRLIFKHMVERIPSGINVSPARPMWNDASDVLQPVAKAGMMQLAYALEQAEQLPRKHELLDRVSQSDDHGRSILDKHFPKWLPHLCALRHPTALNVSPLYICDQVTEGRPGKKDTGFTTRSSEDHQNLYFALIATTLAWVQDSAQSQDVLSHFTTHMSGSGGRQGGGFQANEVSFMFLYHLGSLLNDCTSLFEAKSSLVAVMTMMTAIMAEPAYQHIAPLPSIDHLPFHEWMDIPLPYNQGVFSRCHIGKMATADFLSGEWLGYYSDNRRARLSMTLDHPMVDIFLNATPVDIDGGAPLTSVTTAPERQGRDACGPFRLGGNVLFDGQVRLRKIYTNHHLEWHWRGHLCPFGMVGAWGSVHDSFGGYFWIWKKEWCADTTAVE